MNRWLVKKERPFIIGHRGASADAPENTIAACKLAQAQGADGIEFDVRLSADNHPIIIHDETLDRTTNHSGYAKDFNAKQLDQFDVPTLVKLFDVCGDDFLYNVEVKESGGRADQLITQIGDYLTQFPHLGANVLISSFNFDVLEMAHRLRKYYITLAALRVPGTPFPHHLNCEFDHPHFTMVTEEYMSWVREYGLYVNVWTVDDAAEVERLTRLGVDGIVTNRPSDYVS